MNEFRGIDVEPAPRFRSAGRSASASNGRRRQCQVCEQSGGTLEAASDVRGAQRLYVHRACGERELARREREARADVCKPTLAEQAAMLRRYEEQAVEAVALGIKQVRAISDAEADAILERYWAEVDKPGPADIPHRVDRA